MAVPNRLGEYRSMKCVVAGSMSRFKNHWCYRIPPKPATFAVRIYVSECLDGLAVSAANLGHEANLEP